MRVKYAVIAIAAVLMISGCGEDSVLSVEESVEYEICGDDVIRISLDSENAGRETLEISSHVGGRILEMSYRHYVDAGLTEEDINRIGDKRFRDNLERLYQDLSVVVE